MMRLPAVEISSDSESDEETPRIFSSGRLDSKAGAWVELGSDTNVLPTIEEDWSQPPAIDALLLAQGGREDVEQVYTSVRSPTLPRGSPNLAASMTDVLPDTSGHRSPVSSARDQSPTKLFYTDHALFSSDSSPLQAAALISPAAAAAVPAAAGPRRPANGPVLSLDVLLTDADLEDLLHRLRTGTADLGGLRSQDTPSAASSSSISPSPREAPAFAYQPRWARQHQQQEGQLEDAADTKAAAEGPGAAGGAQQQLQQEPPYVASAATSSSSNSSRQAGARVWSRDHTVQVDLRGWPDGSTSSSNHAAGADSKGQECMPAAVKTHRSCSTSTSTSTIEVEAIAAARPAQRSSKQQHMQASSGSSSSSIASHSTTTEGVVAALQKQQGARAVSSVQAAAQEDGDDSDAASDSSEEEWRQMRQQRQGAAGRLLGA